MIPEAAVRAAAAGMWEKRPMQRTDDGSPLPFGEAKAYLRTRYTDQARAALEAAAPHMLAGAAALVSDLVDVEDCSFDHGGGCQAHGYLSLNPGETCPQYDAKELVKRYGSQA